MKKQNPDYDENCYRRDKEEEDLSIGSLLVFGLFSAGLIALMLFLMAP